MPTLAELRERNDQIETQLREWKQQRFANGENPMDWAAFRKHLEALGAADPGEHPPHQWFRWDESLVGGTPDESAGTTGAYSASRDVTGDEIQSTPRR